MPSMITARDTEMLIQFAAECEAVNIIAENLHRPDISDHVLGDNWRERIENLAWDVRQFGCRYTAENGGLLYDFS